MIVKVAAVHNIAAIASGIARSGADIIAIDGLRGGTGAAPTRIRDNVGIPIELALAAVDQRLRDEGIRDRVSLIVGGSIRSCGGRGEGCGARGGRVLYRDGGAAGAGVPPLPHLPERQLQLGHRDAAGRSWHGGSTRRRARSGS